MENREDIGPNEYSTRDLHFASYLVLKGVIIKTLERYGRDSRGQNPVYFIFEDKYKCQELEEYFWNGVGDEVMINIKDYYTQVRDLRARLSSVTKPTKGR